MKVVSWNIRGLGLGSPKGKAKWERLGKVMCGDNTVMLLQETKIIQEDWDVLKYKCSLKGWDVVIDCCDESRKRGVAILAPLKFDMKKVEVSGGGRCVGAKLKWEGQEVMVYSVYAPVLDADKSGWLENLEFMGDKLIVGGDWNLAVEKKDRS